MNAQLPVPMTSVTPASPSLVLKQSLISSATTVLFIAVYTWLYGWRFGVGLTALVLAHEGGHYFAARLRGLRVATPVMVPLLGAWVRLHDEPPDIETDAYVSIAGPITGALAALGCMILGYRYDSNLLLQLAEVGFLLNFVNLLPILPCDGYHVMGAICRQLRGAGLPLLIVFVCHVATPFAIIIGVMTIISSFKDADEEEDAAGIARYYMISASHRAAYAVVYLLLAGSLGMFYWQVHSDLTNPPVTVDDSSSDDEDPGFNYYDVNAANKKHQPGGRTEYTWRWE